MHCIFLKMQERLSACVCCRAAANANMSKAEGFIREQQLQGKPEKNKNVIKSLMNIKSSLFVQTQTWSCFLASFVNSAYLMLTRL